MATPIPSSVLMDDDQETLSLLLSRKSFDDESQGDEDHADVAEAQEDLELRLHRLSDRLLSELQKDSSSSSWRSISSHWNSLVDSAKDLGFNIPVASTASAAPSASRAQPSADLPKAFSTPEGELHLEATSSLLGCSKHEAGRYTLSAIRSSSSSATLLSATSNLLGTRALLETVLDHYHGQQIAQLQILAELLRLEQSDGSDDDNNPNTWIQDVVLPILQKLDDSFPRSVVHPQGTKQSRGLFRLFLSLSTRPLVPLTRQQLEAARKLRRPVPQSLQESMTDPTMGMMTGHGSSDPTDASTFDAWCHSIMSRHLVFQGREKLESLEALVVLLYARLEGGVGRMDYVLLLLALQSSYGFYTQEQASQWISYTPRLQCLASLVCVECMGLWRMVTTTKASKQESVLWVERHPLLQGIVDDAARFEAEMDAILSLLQQYGSQVISQRQQLQQQGIVDGVMPQGVAVFSLGLLLSGVYTTMLASESHGANTEAYWQTFQKTGLQLSEFANDSCGVFDSVNLALQLMIDKPRRHGPVLSSALHAFPYEVSEFCDDLPVSDPATASTERELSAPSLIYANIFRELLVGIVLAFQDSFFSKHHPNALSNLEMLGNLSALIFRNSPTLCIAFWEEWNMHTLARSKTPVSFDVEALPLCRVLDSTYHLAATVLRTSSRHQPVKSNEEVLRASAPLLTFCSCLVYDAKSSKVVVQDILPPTLLRTVLDAIASRPMNVSVDLFCSILSSLSVFAQTGDSKEAREALRHALEPSSPATIAQQPGPRLLVSIATAFGNEVRVTTLVYKLLSVLVQDAPEIWVMDVASSLHGPWTAPSMGHLPLFPGGIDTGTMELIHSFVKRIHVVVSYESFSELARVSFLSFLEIGVKSCASILPQSLATMTPKRGVEELSNVCSYDLARTALECVAGSLQAIRQVTKLQLSSSIESAADAFRSSLTSMLANSGGLGDAVWYYACCPVILILSGKLTDSLRDVQVLSQAGTPDVTSPTSFLGPSVRLLANPVSRDETLQKVRTILVEAATSEGLDFDFEEIASKGWISHEDVMSVFETSLAALRLLNLWTRSVEDIVLKKGSDMSLLVLSCHRLLLNNSVVPSWCRQIPNFSTLWNASGMNHLTLIMHFLAVTDGRLPTAISTAAFDVLFQTLNHAKGLSKYNSRDMSFIRACCDSKLFKNTIEGAVTNALILSEADGMSLVDCKELSFALRCVRVLALCTRASPSNSFALLGGECSALVPKLCKIVSGTIEELLQPEADFSDVVLLNRMRNACCCLDVILPLWIHSRAHAEGNNSTNRSKASSVADSQIGLLSDLAAFVFGSSHLWRKSDEELTPFALIGNRILFCLLSLCLDVLTVEIDWNLENESALSPDQPLLFALQTALDQRLSRFSGLSGRFLSLGSMDLYSELLKPLVESNGMVEPFEPGDLFGRETFSECSGYDLDALSVRLLVCDEAQNQGLRSLALARGVLDSEMRRVHSWQLFSKSFSRLLRTWRLSSPNHPLLLSMSNGSFSLQCLHVVLGALYDNLIRLEERQAIRRPSNFSDLVISIARGSGRLLLSFSVIEAKESSSIDSWGASLRFVSGCAHKIAYLLRAEPHLGYSCFQQLFTSAASLLSLGKMLSPQGVIGYEEERIALSSTCCSILSLIENKKEAYLVGIEGYSSCFCSCVHLMAALTVVPEGSLNSSQGYATNLYDVFVNHDVLVSILRQTAMGEEVDRSYTAVMSSSLTFFTAVVIGDDQKFVELVMCKAPSLLARCASAFALSQQNQPAGGTPPRGYSLLTSLNDQNGQANAAETDMFHKIWTEGLELLSAAAISSKSASVLIRRHIAATSIDFMKCHRDLILSCLKQCMLNASDSQASVVTINLLREAKFILSIASELCARDVVDTFRRECPDVFGGIVTCCCSLLASMGSFLGASAASRELFKLMSDVENAGELPGNHQFTSLNPFYRLLDSNGFPYAKHEALRLSTSVSRSSMAVTQSEKNAQSEFPEKWKPPHPEPISDPRSLSTLENNCRSAVSSNFAFDMEHAAADALFFAVRILWSTHPSSNSFVPFSEEEAKTLESLPLVKPGSVISFRQSHLEPEAGLRFGEVLQCDTFRRQWRVRLIGESDRDDVTEFLVSDSQLAGIEDVSKRHGVLVYSPAPESKGDLEASMGTPSIGHLILALRWCQQTRSELKNASTLSSQRTLALVQRLAELSTALLGTEVSLHRLIGSHPYVSNKNGVLNAVVIQLRDLFADVEDVAASQSGVSSPSEVVGGLHGILRTAVWDRVREQLRPELLHAREVLESQRDSPHHRRFAGGGESSPWFGASRRSGHRSPFRGLGL